LSMECPETRNHDLTERTMVHETPRGPLTIRANCPPGSFGAMTMDDGLGHFAHYSSIIQKVETFDEVARRRGGRVTLALMESHLIVGYGICWYPEPSERWAALGDLMYEMAAIEVSRTFRGIQLGRRIMDSVMDEDFYDDKITYMQGFSWHWDLEGSGLTAAQYRRLMMDLYRPYGFREVYTNEPNIALREEDVMMIRVGSRVSAEDQKRFRYLRFGMKPPA
jgi:acetoin utilization protein AcuA